MALELVKGRGEVEKLERHCVKGESLLASVATQDKLEGSVFIA